MFKSDKFCDISLSQMALKFIVHNPITIRNTTFLSFHSVIHTTLKALPFTLSKPGVVSSIKIYNYLPLDEHNYMWLAWLCGKKLEVVILMFALLIIDEGADVLAKMLIGGLRKVSNGRCSDGKRENVSK